MPRNPFDIKSIDFWGISKKPKKRKSISFTEKAIIWEKNKSHICHICRQKIHSLTEAEVDHVIAHSNGGQRISWAHRACNRVKGKKSLSEIHKRLGIITKKKKTTKKDTKKKTKNKFPKGNYWINPMTGRKERFNPFGL